MFDFGFWELALIAVIALVVVGPERLPGVLRTVGLFVGKARASMASLRDEVEREVNAQGLRDTERALRRDVEKTIHDTSAPAREVGDELRQAGQSAAVTGSGARTAKRDAAAKVEAADAATKADAEPAGPSPDRKPAEAQAETGAAPSKKVKTPRKRKSAASAGEAKRPAPAGTPGDRS